MSRIAASSLATTSATRRVPSRGARTRPRARLARLPTSSSSATGVPERGRRVHASSEETPTTPTPTRVTLERDAHAGAVLALATIPPDAATGRPLLVVSTSMDGTVATWTLDPSSGAMAPRERLAPADGSAPWWCVVPSGDGDAVYVGTHARDARAVDARRIVDHEHHPSGSADRSRVSNHTGWVRAVAVLPGFGFNDDDERTRTSGRTSVRTSVAGGASAPRATSCARGASTRLKPDEKKLPEHVLTRPTPVRNPSDTCQTRASLASSPATSSRWRPPPAGCSAASRTEPCGGGAFAYAEEVAGSHPRVGRDPSMLDPSRCPRCDAPTTPRTTRAAVNDERSYHVAVATTPGASPRSSPSGHHLRVGAPPPPPPPRNGGSW